MCTILGRLARDIERNKTVLAQNIQRALNSLLIRAPQIAEQSRCKLTPKEQQLKRRQEIEPVIRQLKSDHGMNRYYMKGKIGDAIHVVLCAVGFNIK